jgi:hypothetical protein
VSVSLVRGLANQVVEVRWTGFTPSNESLDSGAPGYDSDNTQYPVMVIECPGRHPKNPGQCPGGENGGTDATVTVFGPQNAAFATTQANGTGQAPIELLTAEQAPELGCDQGKPCSVVIMPSQGGAPDGCSDHSQDGQTDGPGTGAWDFGTNYQCAWAKRIVVPLSFAPTPSDCPVRTPDFSVIGSAMVGRAMESWQAALCQGSNPVSIQYDSAQGEPLARQDFLAGTDDVALTTLPGSGTTAHPYTYAPVAITAESIAFWVDNPGTGEPVSRMKLDPRLVLKLLTQSYSFGDSCPPPTGVSGCDNAVDGNPLQIFNDPEFKKLNPRIAEPYQEPNLYNDYQVPTVLAGESDMTWELTRWIAANKPALGFLEGDFDPWGMHVNTDYLQQLGQSSAPGFPTYALTAMDPYPVVSHLYVPVYPLSLVGQYQVENWAPGTETEQTNCAGNGTNCTYQTVPLQNVGARSLFSILDQADAAAYDLPTASIENGAGRYVAPSDATMTAALRAMTKASNGITEDYNEASKVKDAYPLTMVVYAMVPTGGVSSAKAAKIAQWLDFIANEGQQTGTNPGDLPPGYLPLTESMRQQTLKAAYEVLNQTGTKSSASASAPASASASASPSTATPSPTATPTASPTTQGSVSLGYVTNPPTSGIARYALPILLIAGGLLAVAGSSALVLGRGSAAVAAQLKRLGRVRLQWRKKKP